MGKVAAVMGEVAAVMGEVVAVDEVGGIDEFRVGLMKAWSLAKAIASLGRGAVKGVL